MSNELDAVINKVTQRRKVRANLPKAKDRPRELDGMESLVIYGAEKTFVERQDFSSMSNEELAAQYHFFDNQTQLIKGMILLEGRSRFTTTKKGTEKNKGSFGFDKLGFGRWITENGLDVDKKSSRDNFMNLAEFFKGKEFNKIVLSAAYKLAAAKYKPVADAVYNHIKGKNIPFITVEKLLDRRLYEYENGIPFTPLSSPAALNSLPTLLPVTEQNPPKANASQQNQDVTVDQTTTITGGFDNAQNVSIGGVTTMQGSTLGNLMPLDILKMSSTFKSSEKRTATEDRRHPEEPEITQLDEVPEDSPVYGLKESMSEEEKIWQVKELINILSISKAEAHMIADEVAEFFTNRFLGEN